MDLPRANHVPDLEENKEVEDEGNVARVLVSVHKSLSVPEWLSVDLILSSWGDTAVFWLVSEIHNWLWDDEFSVEDEESDKDELEDTHVENMLGHLS